MQRQPLKPDAALAQRVLQRRSEMQPRRGGSDRALLACEHGLIIGDIAIVSGALARDIGRQRRAADIADGLVEHRAMERERQRYLAVGALMLDLGVEIAEQADPALIAETDAVTLREFLCRLHQRLPARAVEALDKGRVDLRLGLAPDAAAMELRRNHLGVVDDELVAGSEKRRQ